MGTCRIFWKESASRVSCIILLFKHEDCHINHRLSFKLYIIVLWKSTNLLLQTKRKARFFPLFPLLHVTVDLQKSYKMGLTGWLDRFMAALYPCNSRYQGKHSQIGAWGSKHYSRYRANLLNVACIACLPKAADSLKQSCGKVDIIPFISMQY